MSHDEKNEQKTARQPDTGPDAVCAGKSGKRHSAEWGGIYGTGDKYGDYRELSEDEKTLTYNFDGDSALVINADGNDISDRKGIYVGTSISDPKNIIIDNKLDISLTNKKGDINGIFIDTVDGKSINRSKGGKIEITQESPESAYISAVKISGTNNSISIGNSEIKIDMKNPISNGEVYGLYAISGSNNSINMGDGSIVIDVNESKDLWMMIEGISAYYNNTITTGDINLKVSEIAPNKEASWAVRGIMAADGALIEIGKDGASTETVKNVIDVTAEGAGNISAMGALAANATIKFDDITNITTTTKGGEANSAIQSIALAAMGNGSISYVGGTITASADNDKATVRAVHAQDAADIDINKGTNNTVVINGNVNNSGTGAIYLNLNTADSVLNGAVSDEKGTFNLENGAQWNVLGASTVNEFHITNGIINMDRNYNVNIASYFGNGTISFLAKDQAADGVANFENVGNVTIKEAEKGASVTLEIANDKIDTLDLEKTEENLNALAKKISYKANDGNLIGKAVIREGLITPEASGDLVFSTTGNSVTNITGGDRTTETMYAMKNLAATAIVAWRQEDSTFSQRIGELRESTGGQGIWARMSRGEFEYDGEYKNQYNFFQLGYDWASDNWHYGVAVSHNDGETAYTYGSGENRSTSLSLYGTWLGDAGHYADIVLKQGRLSNDFDVYTSAGHTSGDYDAWGTSLSGEYGKKILLENDWYVTPQAQLTLMRIGGEDYDTNNGIRVRQDTLYSAVGRLGFELGRKLDEKGSVYAKASVLHDFAGNAETYLSDNGFTNSYSQDLSDTWFEAGIGFNYRTGDNSYIYADVVRTFGGDVETPWQWNIGMRWSC